MGEVLWVKRERQVRRLKEAEGYWTTRAAGSFGDADVFAARAEPESRLMIEVKSTTAGPFHSFGPKDRLELIRAAQKAGAEAWLCWWPPRKPPTWIPADEWPSIDGARVA